MFFATGIILYRVVSYGRPVESRRKLAYLVTSLLSAIGVYHCVANEILVHQATFVVMLAIVAFRTANLIKTRIKDANLKQRMNRMARSGFSMS